MALVASPQTEHHYAAQYYLFQQLWFGIGKLYQEERRQDSNLRSCRKKISIDHVCSTSLAKIPQLVTEYATYVMTWNKSLSLSGSPTHFTRGSGNLTRSTPRLAPIGPYPTSWLWSFRLREIKSAVQIVAKKPTQCTKPQCCSNFS